MCRIGAQERGQRGGADAGGGFAEEGSAGEMETVGGEGVHVLFLGERLV